MRKLVGFVTLSSALVLGALLVLVLAPASRSDAGIAGTNHDLSARGWGTNEICVFCHTPHNANTAVAGAPLWNHKVTTAAFTLYSSPTFNGSASIGQPDGNSKLCLSCHDGTVALDSYAARTGTNFISGGALLDTALNNDHPISFTYDAALATADGGLVTPADASWVDGAHTVPLYSGKLQCGTCHSVHDNSNGRFLRMSNAGSALCLKCHNK
jgi:predicted CXXCH cytochrome family protein